MKKLLMMIVAAAIALATALPMVAYGAAAIESPSDGTVVYWYWGDNNGEGASYTHKADINSAESFKFRTGVANINSNGTVKVGGGKSSDQSFGNWVGANGYAATLNINGGTFWSYAASGGPYGLLRVGVNGGSNDSTVNLNSGVLKVEGALYIGGTKWNSYEAYAKNGVVNIYGGTATVPKLSLGTETAGSYANATLNLEGGTLEVSKFYLREYHNQVFNWGNGTIKATADNVFLTATPLSGCTRTAQVTGTPAVFDLNGHTSDISPALTNGTGTLKLTGGGTAYLYKVPKYSFYLDKNTTLQLQTDISNALAVDSKFTFSGVANVTGGLVLSDGAKITCDLAAADGSFCSLEATLGFILPSGVGSVLDVLELVLPEGKTTADFTVSLSADGKTISVAPNITPVTAVWNVQGVADSPSCWTCYDRDGVTVIDGAIPAGSTTNVTLAADADWTAPGALDFARGAVIDLAGHNLVVSNISYLSIFSRTTVTNSSSALSTLTVRVPGSTNVDNTDVSITGHVKFVKEGAGTFVSSVAQTYTGGTLVAAGTAQEPANSVTYGGEGDFTVYGTGEITVESNATFTVQSAQVFKNDIVLAGGRLYGNLRGVVAHLARVMADSQIFLNGSGFTMYVGTSGSHLDLDGYTLTFSGGTGEQYFYIDSSLAGETGTFVLDSSAEYVCRLPVDGNGVDLEINTRADMSTPASVHDYKISGVQTQWGKGTAYGLDVYGTFTPVSATFYGCTMMNGSTIDLSGKTGVWSIQSSIPNVASGLTAAQQTARKTVSFADNATVGVRLGNRKITREGLKVIDWTDNTPSNLSGLRFVCADDGRNYRLRKESDGLYAYRSGFMIIVE